jgi:hypothetical protein
MTRGSIAAIAAIDPEATRVVVGRPTSVALGGWPGSTPGRAWASCASFSSDLASGAIPADVRAVMYDPEGWEATPLDERRDPIASIRTFARLARASGYLTIVTPHPALVEVPGSPLLRSSEESREEAYLRSSITFETARCVDVCEIQAQRFQRDPDAYRAVVSQEVEQARAAKPDVVVISGLSTHPGYRATWKMLLDAWESVRDLVDGHYLSLARLRHPRAAARFLRAVIRREAAGYR